MEAVSDQTRKKVEQENDKTAMAGMFDLGNRLVPIDPLIMTDPD